MALATINSRALVGISTPPVSVEVHLSRGLPSFSIVGLPETAVKESRDRVRSAILNSGFEFPNQKISVNLAPADLPKVGGRFDLPIAVGVLTASGQIPEQSIINKVFLGELALSGKLRTVSGGLLTALSLVDGNMDLILPIESAREAALAKSVNIYPVKSLTELSAALNGLSVLQPLQNKNNARTIKYGDMSDVAGQLIAKKALEIAASGNHSMIMMGAPGSGKTMLANRLPGILPELSEKEALESAAISSICDDFFDIAVWKSRPFRSPHHNASCGSLIGGGSIPRPGEITRAHNGILFLDELTEFNTRSLDALREPMENGYINVARVSLQTRFPAKFLLIAATNPCKCGYHGDPSGICRCSPDQVQKYLSRLSGPLLDRIDIQLQVTGVKHQELKATGPHGDSSKAIRSRVLKTRQQQYHRQGKLNSELTSTEIQQYCKLSKQEDRFLEEIFTKLQLSARGYHRVLKLARTIADIHDSASIEKSHLSLAVTLRYLDKKVFSNAY